MERYLGYKDSGIEWIGEVPAKWEMKKVKHLVDLIIEKAENSSEVSFRIALENIESFTGKYLNGTGIFEGMGNYFQRDDILFNKLRPYLAKVFMAPSDGVALGELLVLRPKPESDKTFLLYRFLSKPFVSVVNGATYGAKMPRANWELIGNLKVPVPDSLNQKIIGSYLNHKTHLIDTLIEKEQKQIELLQEQRAAIINQAVTKGLNPNVKMKDSGIEWLGEVPEHWRLSKIRYELQAGRIEHQDGNHGELHPKADDYVDDGIPFVMANNVNLVLDLDNCKKIPKEIADSLRIGFSILGDVLLTHKGTIGRTAIVEKIDTNYIMLTPQVTYYRCKHGIENRYLRYFFDSDFFQTQLKVISSKGSTRNYIGLIAQKDTVLCMPELNEQKKISDFIDLKTKPIKESVLNTHREIDLLKEYRTTLISEVVTGKIDVRDEVIP